MRGWLAALAMSFILYLAVCWPAYIGNHDESAVSSMPITGLDVPGMQSYDEIIPSLMEKYSIPGGVVAVAKEGRLVLLRGYGYSDVDRGEAIQPEALFRIASLSKQITSAAILKLVDDGRLALDAEALPIIDHLTPPAGAAVDARLQNITVSQLLTHSGGWDREITFDPMLNPVLAARVVGAPSPGSAETIIRYMLGQPLQFDPGAKYVYSNFGYNVLGRIVEKITGMSYAQYVQDHILAPMGIVRMRLGKTRLEDRAEGEVRYYDYPGAPLSTSVFSDVSGEVPVPYGGFYIEAMDAHGGWIASSSDLIRFTLGIEGRRGPALLNANTIGTMLARPPVSTWETSSYWYGMGWWVRPADSGTNWWHSGSLPGSLTFQVRAYNGLNWVALFNTRPQNLSEFQGELNEGLWAASQQVTAWPDHDLFLHSYGFAIANKGLTSVTTAGLGATVAGYARIQPIQGSTTPSGLAVFGLQQSGVLVSEAAVPASPLIRSGRVYAEVRPPANTGLAIANPSDQAAHISFYFTDASGQTVWPGNTTIGGNSQIAVFLNQPPFGGGSPLSGTFTFSSDIPIAAVALRGYTNERSEFLMTTSPIAPVTAQPAETLFFPHLAAGNGWTTRIVLVNPSDEPISGSIQFWDQGRPGFPGQPAQVVIEGQTSNVFSYAIPARSSRVLEPGPAAGAYVGSARVLPGTDSTSPSGLAIFSYNWNGVTVTEAGVPAAHTDRAFRLYVETSGVDWEAGSIQTGIAIANASTAPAEVELELTRPDGTSTGMTGTITVPGNGQIATFLKQIPGFEDLQNPFRGVLRVSASSLFSSSISVIGLRGRYNERRDFLITTTPPSSEAETPSNSEMLFPHLADGGGYTTQFVLFSGSSGQSSCGMLRLFSQSGQPLMVLR